MSVALISCFLFFFSAKTRSQTLHTIGVHFDVLKYNLNYLAHLPLCSFPILAHQNIKKDYIIQIWPEHYNHMSQELEKSIPKLSSIVVWAIKQRFHPKQYTLLASRTHIVIQDHNICQFPTT